MPNRERARGHRTAGLYDSPKIEALGRASESALYWLWSQDFCKMEQPDDTSTHEPDKAAVDASPPGSLTISADSSARVQSSAFGEALSQLLQRFQNEDAIVLTPLRLVVLTAELGNVVSRWQRALGLPEAGISQQPEGTAVAKTMSWGRDAESARSLIIMADYMAAGVVASNSIAISTLVHELGHVHDDFARGVVLGFRELQIPAASADWPRVCAFVAEIAWSEYAAESLAASQMTREDLRTFLLNDPLHLAGVDERLRQAVWSYKCRQRDLASLWNNSVTELSDIFANLGRAIARLPFADNYEEALARLVEPDAEAARWKPVIERLIQELESLGSTGYAAWGAAPFSGIQEAIAEGFQAVGLFPTHDGSRLHVRVV